MRFEKAGRHLELPLTRIMVTTLAPVVYCTASSANFLGIGTVGWSAESVNFSAGGHRLAPPENGTEVVDAHSNRMHPKCSPRYSSGAPRSFVEKISAKRVNGSLFRGRGLQVPLPLGR